MARMFLVQVKSHVCQMVLGATIFLQDAVEMLIDADFLGAKSFANSKRKFKFIYLFSVEMQTFPCFPESICVDISCGVAMSLCTMIKLLLQIAFLTYN